MYTAYDSKAMSERKVFSDPSTSSGLLIQGTATGKEIYFQRHKNSFTIQGNDVLWTPPRSHRLRQMVDRALELWVKVSDPQGVKLSPWLNYDISEKQYNTKRKLNEITGV